MIELKVVSDTTTQLECTGFSRDGDRGLRFFFNRKPTDSEMQFLNECMERSAELAE